MVADTGTSFVLSALCLPIVRAIHCGTASLVGVEVNRECAKEHCQSPLLLIPRHQTWSAMRERFGRPTPHTSYSSASVPIITALAKRLDGNVGILIVPTV